MKPRASGSTHIVASEKKSAKKTNAFSKYADTMAKHPVLLLLGIFLLSSIIRYVFSANTANMPTVYIDEGLYVNIARSLFNDGQVMYRDQPITYVYLLYPIFLLPLFLLPSAVSLYRAMQFYNALLISSMVFPAYLLGRKLDLGKNKSVLLAILTCLVPELALSSFLTCESLYYPMMVWMFVLGADLCRLECGRRKTVVYLALGLLTGLSYFVKPVCVIFGVCFTLIDMIAQLRAKKRWAALLAACSLLLTALTVVMGYLVYHMRFGSATVLNLYEKQLSDTSMASIPIMLQSVPYHILALTFGCGGAFLILPFFYRERYSACQQKLMISSMLSVAASVIGIAIMIVPYNYTGSGLTCPVHLRYLMFYFPLLFAFLLSPALSGAQSRKAPVITLIVFTALSIFPSAFHFFNYQAGTFDAPALNAFYTDRTGGAFGVALIVLSVLFMIYVLRVFMVKGWNRKMTAQACMIVVCFFCINGMLSYTNRRTVENDIELAATEIAQDLVGEDALIVTTNDYDDFRGFSLDSHLRQPMQMVVVNDMLVNAIETGGVYRPWTPYVQSPNTMNNPTIDTDTLVFDVTVADYVELAPDVQTTRYGIYYTIAKIIPDKPFLKTAIAGMHGYTIYGKEPASFLVFDSELLANREIKLFITMKCAHSDTATVTFASGVDTKQIEVTDSYQQYELSLGIDGNIQSFYITSDSDIDINRYSTV